MQGELMKLNKEKIFMIRLLFGYGQNLVILFLGSFGKDNAETSVFTV